MTTSAPALPAFCRTAAADGALRFCWPPFAAARAALIVALRDPASFSPDAFWGGEVDNDLIRVPVDASTGAGAAWVPAGRAVAVALVARDAEGRWLPAPAPTALHDAAVQHGSHPAGDGAQARHVAVQHGSPLAEDGPQAHHVAVQHGSYLAGEGTPACHVAAQHGSPPARASSPTLSLAAPTGPAGPLDGPVAHSEGPSRATPFIFVAGDGVPDLAALARRVAQAASGQSAPALPAAPPAGCYGARPKWYLTRLALPAPSGLPRTLFRRDHFIAAEDLAAWATAPPEDATPLPSEADGVVDGLAEGDATVFYALLEGPAPWRALPLGPLLPPFSESAHPFALGAAADRLERAVDARLAALAAEAAPLADLVPLVSLLEAASAWLPEDHPVRVRVLGALAALTTEPRF